MTQTAKKSHFSMNVDLMHGPIFKNLLLFMLPIFISNLFQQLYNTVDTMIVGNVPVSYTHLDVYKRQPQRSHRLGPAPQCHRGHPESEP